MRVENQGPSLTPKDIEAFESRTNVKVPADLVWFLTTIANGGYVEKHPVYSIEDPTGTEESDLHGLYGINHPANYYNLEEVLTYEFASRLSNTFLLGYDSGNSQIALITSGERVGEVVFIPWEVLCDTTVEPAMWRITSSLREFVKLVSQPSLFRRTKGRRALDKVAANKNAHLPNTPQGYSWHYHQDPGRMELVPTTIHLFNPHPGGYNLWPK